MPQDAAAKLRAELVQHLRELYRLEVVEAAEDTVRRRCMQLLSSELAGLCEELTQAREQLAAARDGDNLARTVVAEERVCDILRQTTITQRQTGEQIRAFKLARDAFLARRDQLTTCIDRLRRLVG